MSACAAVIAAEAILRDHARAQAVTRHVFIGRGHCCLCGDGARGLRIAINRGAPRLLCEGCISAVIERSWSLFVQHERKEEK